MGHNKLAMEWVSAKVKSIKVPRILGTKFSFKNKFKETKTRKRYNKNIMIRTRKNKTTFKWRAISKEKCLIRKRNNSKSQAKKAKRFLMSKWAKLIMTKNSRT